MFVNSHCDIVTQLPGYDHCSTDYAKRQSQMSVCLSVCLSVRTCICTSFCMCVCVQCVCCYGCLLVCMYVRMYRNQASKQANRLVRKQAIRQASNPASKDVPEHDSPKCVPEAKFTKIRQYMTITNDKQQQSTITETSTSIRNKQA